MSAKEGKVILFRVSHILLLHKSDILKKMKYSIALVLLIESINKVNGFISSRLPNTLGLQALGARGVSGGGENKNNPLDD